MGIDSICDRYLVAVGIVLNLSASDPPPITTDVRCLEPRIDLLFLPYIGGYLTLYPGRAIIGDLSCAFMAYNPKDRTRTFVVGFKRKVGPDR